MTDDAMAPNGEDSVLAVACAIVEGFRRVYADHASPPWPLYPEDIYPAARAALAACRAAHFAEAADAVAARRQTRGCPGDRHRHGGNVTTKSGRATMSERGTHDRA